MRRPITIFASILLASSGCGLYTGGAGHADGGPRRVPDAAVCNYGAAPPAVELRNPETGQCQTFGYCDPQCGVCPPVPGPLQPSNPPPAQDAGSAPAGSGTVTGTTTGAGTTSIVAQPTWGLCTSQCSGLDENSCLATAGCRAAYLDTGEALGSNGTPDRPVRQYYGCWATDMTGPIEGGGCSGLDADTCSRHDDCIAIHTGIYDSNALTYSLGDFESCAPEPNAPSCTNDSDCASGYHCDTSNCPVDCPAGIPCDCRGTCVADSDPGTCYGDVTCESPTPACPSGTVPGVKNGCYTGYCIPTDQCGPAPACDTITDEATCINRSDCTPIYQGQDCTCDASGSCTCQSWVFTSCQPAVVMDPPPLPPPTPVDGGSAPTSGGGSAPAP